MISKFRFTLPLRILLVAVLIQPSLFAEKSESKTISESGSEYVLSRKCAVAMATAGVSVGAFSVLVLPYALSFVGFTAAAINAETQEATARSEQTKTTDKDVQKIWDEKTQEWLKFIGPDGRYDLNRLYQSDPLLWRFLGTVAEKTVLDMGCGNGYLSRQLNRAGAHVIAVDLSAEMIAKAKEISQREQYFGIDFRVESGSALPSIPDESVDRLVSNYVLMDCADLTANIASMYRVLKYGGKAVIVILHPSFPLKYRTKKNGYSTFRWENPYLDSHEQVTPPFDDAFSRPFLVFHRSFTEYWQAFIKAGFIVHQVEEPKLTDEQKKLLEPELVKDFETPISLVFVLHKNAPSTPLSDWSLKFDLKKSRRAFNDNPTGYLAGGVSSFILSVVGGQATQYVLASAVSAVPGAALFCIPATGILHIVTACDSVERLATLYTGHDPVIIKYNPTAYLASFLVERFEALRFVKDPEGSKWNQAFEQGQRDLVLFSTVINGLASAWQLAAGVRTWFKDPRESHLNFKTMSLSKTSKVRVGSIHSHGNSEWSLWRGSDNKKALYADIQGILDNVDAGWRLPTINELKSYYSSDRPRTQQFSGQYWSTKENLFFDFKKGKETNCKPGHKAKILLVRLHSPSQV